MSQTGMPLPRILIVDDEIDIRRILQMHLKRKGFEVDIASGLTEASAMIAANPAYNLVVCDFRMPDGSGVEVFHKLKPTTKFILISGFSDMDENQLNLRGISQIITKPVNMAQLLEKIKTNI